MTKPLAILLALAALCLIGLLHGQGVMPTTQLVITFSNPPSAALTNGTLAYAVDVSTDLFTWKYCGDMTGRKCQWLGFTPSTNQMMFVRLTQKMK